MGEQEGAIFGIGEVLERGEIKAFFMHVNIIGSGFARCNSSTSWMEQSVGGSRHKLSHGGHQESTS